MEKGRVTALSPRPVKVMAMLMVLIEAVSSQGPAVRPARTAASSQRAALTATARQMAKAITSKLRRQTRMDKHRRSFLALSLFAAAFLCEGGLGLALDVNRPSHFLPEEG